MLYVLILKVAVRLVIIYDIHLTYYFQIYTTFNVFLRGPPAEADNIEHIDNCPIIYHSRASSEKELRKKWKYHKRITFRDNLKISRRRIASPFYCVTQANCLSLPSLDSYQAAKLAASIRAKIEDFR